MWQWNCGFPHTPVPHLLASGLIHGNMDDQISSPLISHLRGVQRNDTAETNITHIFCPQFSMLLLSNAKPQENHRESFKQPIIQSCLGIRRKYCRPGTGVSMSRQKSWIQEFKDFILQVGIDFPVVESVHYSSNKSIICITQRPLLSRLPWFRYNIGYKSWVLN